MEAAVTQEKAERTEGRLAFEWRRLKTGLCWVIFGLGGLGLSMTYFPYLRLTVGDPVARRLKARAMIARCFDFYARTMDRLGVMMIERGSLAQMRSLRGTIIVANHPTILDYVLTASMLPEMDCLVKASLRHNFFLKHVIRAADYMSNDGSLETLEEITRRLEAGENILIFPEGTRTRAGVPMKLKRGVAHAALRTGCRLAVVHIRSSHAWLNKDTQWYEIPVDQPDLRGHDRSEGLPEGRRGRLLTGEPQAHRGDAPRTPQGRGPRGRDRRKGARPPAELTRCAESDGACEPIPHSTDEELMNNLENEVKALIIEALNLEDMTPEDIETDAPLFGEGLGLDSIDALELGLAVKKRFGVSLSGETEEVRAHFRSVASLAAFIRENRTEEK